MELKPLGTTISHPVLAVEPDSDGDTALVAKVGDRSIPLMYVNYRGTLTRLTITAADRDLLNNYLNINDDNEVEVN